MALTTAVRVPAPSGLSVDPDISLHTLIAQHLSIAGEIDPVDVVSMYPKLAYGEAFSGSDPENRWPMADDNWGRPLWN